MTSRFVACSSCARHVRAGDCSCPFCGAKAPCVRPLRSITERLSRAAMHAAGAAGAIVVITDCSSSPTVSAFYGAPNIGDSGVVMDAAADAADASMISFYGAPPQDAGTAAEAEASRDARDESEDANAADAPEDGGGEGGD